MSYFDDEEEGRIQAETIDITIALICQISSNSKNYIRMKKQVDHIIHRHEILFTGILRKLDSLSIAIDRNEINRQDIIDDLLCLDLTRIFDSLIGNDGITWGRVITILAFSTFTARKHNEIADRIACVTGQYLVKRLTTWIKSQGGWDSMALLDSEYDVENLNRTIFFSLTCVSLSLIGLFLVLR